MTASRKTEKQRAASEYLALVSAALAAAHIAAATAFAHFARTAERTPEGRVVDIVGGAWVALHRPTYRLRVALRSLGELRKWDSRGWIVSNFSKHVVREQSVTAHRTTCEAACLVLDQQLGGDGKFYTHSFRD